MEAPRSSGSLLRLMLTVWVVLVDASVLGKVASWTLSGSGSLGGLPRLLAAAAGSDIGGDGPVFGDDRFRFVGVDGTAVGGADDIGHAAVHDCPEALSEVLGLPGQERASHNALPTTTPNSPASTTSRWSSAVLLWSCRLSHLLASGGESWVAPVQ